MGSGWFARRAAILFRYL